MHEAVCIARKGRMRIVAMMTLAVTRQSQPFTVRFQFSTLVPCSKGIVLR